MLAWVSAVCQAHSSHISVFYGDAAIVVVWPESICVLVLVGSNPSTHLTVLNAVAGKGDGGATYASITSITTPDFCPQVKCPLLKSRGTLLVGVSHVYVGHPHPTSSRVAAVLVHITVDLDRMHGPIGYPVVV